jgi:CSLREA domain-containing protein
MIRRRAVLTLLTALFALALPAVASAAVTYTVDSVGDEPDNDIGAGDCETAVGTCTLRAAIQELNFSTGVKDKIDFDTLFNGKPGHTIALESALPHIVDPILIDGDGVNDSRCMNATFSINGPCVEVSGPNASTPALVVDNADDVTIEGLSVTGSRTAIDVVNSSSNFVAHGDWLGVKLDGAAAGNTTGIFLDPDSNGATIGGTSAADRNVFGNNTAEGLDIEGADNADVVGNYFGVKPDGATQAANGKNVEITDTVAFEANGDEVGTTVASGAAPCDGGCNVISGSSGPGIDLVGDGIGQNELPASGPTTVRGNYVGLNSGGVTTVSAGPSSTSWPAQPKTSRLAARPLATPTT